MYWLSCLLQSSDRSGHPVTASLFRPINDSKSGFLEAGFSSSTLNADVKAVLKAGGVFRGHTAHSMRRSALQHASQEGASTEQLLDKALITTAAPATKFSGAAPEVLNTLVVWRRRQWRRRRRHSI